MGSAQDKANMRAGSSDSEMNYNADIANSQRDKTAFRAHKTALNADQYNPDRLSNAIQQTLQPWGT